MRLNLSVSDNPNLTLAILRYKGAADADPTTVEVPGHKLLDSELHPIAEEMPGKLGDGPPDVGIVLNIAQVRDTNTKGTIIKSRLRLNHPSLTLTAFPTSRPPSPSFFKFSAARNDLKIFFLLSKYSLYLGMLLSRSVSLVRETTHSTVSRIACIFKFNGSRSF